MPCRRYICKEEKYEREREMKVLCCVHWKCNRMNWKEVYIERERKREKRWYVLVNWGREGI